MNIHRLRNSQGKVMGVVLQFGPRPAPEIQALAPSPARTLWKVCNICTDNEAVIYCRVHSVYVCLECIQAHEIMEGAKVVQECNGFLVLASTWDVANRCEYLSRSTALALLH
jgi:hypothetical protein